MALDWSAFFAPPISSSGLSNGNHTALDEWPPSTDEAYVQNSSGGSSTVQFGFDLSSAPGDKKGFWVWVRWRSNAAAGYSINAVRLLDGATELYEDSSPGIAVGTSEAIQPIRIPDSAFATDPDLDDLRIEFDITNLQAGNNRLFFEMIRLSKSPFTAAQEATPPADLAGSPRSVYRASDLGVLGAADAEAIVVWPDASGQGRHLVRWTGTDATYETGTPDQVYFAGAGTRFIAAWDGEQTPNVLYHAYLFPVDSGIDMAIVSTALEFVGAESAGSPGQKILLAIDDEYLQMNGVGDGPSHVYSGVAVTFDAWQRVTAWYQASGNEHLWMEDDASPIIDAASGANNLYAISVGNRESDDRPYEGGVAELWVLTVDGVSEGDIDNARDEWVNGPSGEEASGGSTAAVAVTAEGAGTAARSSGSAAAVTVAAEGAGTTDRSGASAAAVSVDTEGEGSKHAKNGSEGSVIVTAEGAGTGSAVVSGGSTAQVTAAGEGAGSKHAASGSEAQVTVDASGAGSGGEIAAGGSTAVVTVDAEGAGSTARSGGSTAAISVTATGAGTKHAASGSEADVTVEAEGAGSSVETASGGSTANISVSSEGAGTAERTGGSTADVTAAAAGAGWKAAFGSAQAQIVVTAQGSGSLLRPWTQVDLAGDLDEVTLSGTTNTNLRGVKASPTLKGRL